MSEAPERVWLDSDAEGEGQHTRCFGNPKYCSEPAIEYIRADLVDTLLKQAWEDALREAVKLCSLKLAEPWTDTTTIIPNEYTAEVIRRKILTLIEEDKTDG